MAQAKEDQAAGGTQTAETSDFSASVAEGVQAEIRPGA